MLLTLLIERCVFAAISISGVSLDLLRGMYLVSVSVILRAKNGS